MSYKVEKKADGSGESVLEILVALDKRPHSYGYVLAAASRTKAQYQVRGLTFRDTTEGSTPAIAVRFDIDTRSKWLGGNWHDVFELFEHYFTEDGGKHNAIIGYNLSGLLRQQKSAPPGEREALAIFRQVTAEGKASPRKKAVGARAPKPAYSKAYLAAKGMKRRNPREVSVSRTLRTAPGGAWYGVIYHGGGAGGYRSPDEVAKAILGPFEKRADIPTRLGQFSDGGFIRAVKLTAPMPNWMRKLPNLDTLVATVKGTKRRNPLPMETDPFHPSKWLGNSTKGATLWVAPKRLNEAVFRQPARGTSLIEKAVSLKSGFPLAGLSISYKTEIPRHFDSADQFIARAPGHLLYLDYIFNTPEGDRRWLVCYGAHRPAQASEWHPEAPTSLVEASRFVTRDFASRFGQARRNPPLSQQQQRKLMQALESDARTLAGMANRPGGATQFALFDENGNRMIDWTLDMVGGSQEDPELGMRPHPRWIIAPHAVGDEFDVGGTRYRVTAPNRAVRFALVRPKYDWDRTGEQVVTPLGPPMKKNGRGRGR